MIGLRRAARPQRAPDKIENDLHRAVCAGRISLAAAPTAIAADWTAAEHHLGLTQLTLTMPIGAWNAGVVGWSG